MCVSISQSTFIYIVLFTIQIVSKQLHSDNMKIIQQSLFLEENCVIIHNPLSIMLLNIKCPHRPSSVWLWYGQHYSSEVRLDQNIQNIYHLVGSRSHHVAMEMTMFTMSTQKWTFKFKPTHIHEWSYSLSLPYYYVASMLLN